MSESLSLDETIAKLKAEARAALKNVIIENKQRFEASLVSHQQHLIEKLNPHLIKFNVGGHKFVTNLATLSNIKDTKLHKMATGRYPITLDKKNRIFIDRNGEYFGYVLDCLRKGKVELPSDSFLSSCLQKEYEFFELVSSSSSNNSQKEETKVNKTEKLATPSLFGAAKPVTTISSKANSNGQENFTWRFSSQIEGELGVDSGPDRIMIEATEIERHTIGDTLLTSGIHQWRFFVEETSHVILPNGVENDMYCEGVVVFGVVTKQMWEKLKNNGDYDLISGFNTIAECLKADSGSKGPKVDGPDEITEIGCQNQEITLTFNTQSGVLKLTVKGQEKSHMLIINGSAGNEYCPYFQLSDARVRLLETKELNEGEVYGMDFIMEEALYNDEENNEEDDYEDVENDEDE